MKRLIIIVLILCLLFPAALGEDVYPTNPLIEPNMPIPTIETPKRFFNVLLLGIDYGEGDNVGSAGKSDLLDCHTDAVMVAAVDMEEGMISLVSIPRDTLSYVPGVRGIYKYNGAVNCADEIRQGLEHSCATASRFLGGIAIDAYCAIDLTTMVDIGDAIGGIDYELDMAYTYKGRKYKKGMQHLDGRGISDYLRARRNATVNANDIGRTGRQRELLTALANKVMADPTLIASLTNRVLSADGGLYTNMNMLNIASLLPVVTKAKFNSTSYVFTGPYDKGMDKWNFTFTDQKNRIEVIQNVWGVTVTELPYVSKAYTDWLYESGFKSLRAITVAEVVMANLPQADPALTEAHQAATNAFTAASYTLSKGDQKTLTKAISALKAAADEAAQAAGFTEYKWTTSKEWDNDRLINQCQIDWR